MTKVVVVTGSRDWRNIEVVQAILTRVQQRWPEEAIILRHGCASGADAIARSVAKFFGWLTEDWWPDYMKGASFAESNLDRNVAMLDAYPIPDLVLAFPTAKSRGTWHTVREAKKRGIEVLVTP